MTLHPFAFAYDPRPIFFVRPSSRTVFPLMPIICRFDIQPASITFFSTTTHAAFFLFMSILFDASLSFL